MNIVVAFGTHAILPTVALEPSAEIAQRRAAEAFFMTEDSRVVTVIGNDGEVTWIGAPFPSIQQRSGLPLLYLRSTKPGAA